MKVNDVNKPSRKKLDELDLASFFGDVGSASIKSLFGGNTKKAQLAQDMFIKDFVGDAVSSIKTGLSSGLLNIDSDATGSTGTASPTTDVTSQQPASDANNDGKDDKTGKPITRQPGAKGVSAAQKKTSQNVNNYIKKVATTLNQANSKEEKMKLAKELVNFMADRKGNPEWQNSSATVQQVIKKNVQDPNFANAAINRLKAGEVMTEAKTVMLLNMIFEAAGITWEELGIRVLKETFTSRYVLVEAESFGSLLESKLYEQAGMSVSQYISGWMDKYMAGTTWKPKGQARFDELADQLQKDIQASKGKISGQAKKTLKQMAELGWAASALSGDAPAGAPDQIKKAMDNAPEQPQQGQTSSSNVDDLVTGIQNNLNQLKKVDQNAYSQVVSKISKSVR